MMAVVYNATIAALYRRHKETAAMKTNDPRPAHASSHDASAAAADPTVASPAAAPSGNAQAAACGRKTEVGYTLQTLIVTAVFVLAAVGVGIGLLAINSSSSSDFEEAGRTGVEKRCMPNEVWEPELEARGADGINQRYRGTIYSAGVISAQIRPEDQIVADNIGCNPICGTWEYYDPGRAAAGIGGPEGSGGVYSTAKGCFAPCYWIVTGDWTKPRAREVHSSESRLRYFDDNRAPLAKQYRLGVNYRRSVDPDPTVPVPTVAIKPSRGLQQQQDLFWYNNGNSDGKPPMHGRWKPGAIDGRGGARAVAGTLPLSPAQIAYGFPTVFKPNWFSNGSDPGGAARNSRPGYDNDWEDENWEVHADPIKKVCTIVNTTLDDQVVCSSEWDNCDSAP